MGCGLIKSIKVHDGRSARLINTTRAVSLWQPAQFVIAIRRSKRHPNSMTAMLLASRPGFSEYHASLVHELQRYTLCAISHCCDHACCAQRSLGLCSNVDLSALEPQVGKMWLKRHCGVATLAFSKCPDLQLSLPPPHFCTSIEETSPKAC